MLPVKKHPANSYRTLLEIRKRKDQLLDELQKDNEQFSTLWSQIFIKQKDSSRGEYLSSMVTHSITAVDTFLMIRKLLKNYHDLFGKKKRKR
jgi:hypothetical protein